MRAHVKVNLVMHIVDDSPESLTDLPDEGTRAREHQRRQETSWPVTTQLSGTRDVGTRDDAMRVFRSIQTAVDQQLSYIEMLPSAARPKPNGGNGRP